MRTKETIVIIGTGCTGKAIASRLAGENFHLLLCDKEYAKAEVLANEIKNTACACEVEAMQCSFDGAWEADIIILTMHFDEQKQVAAIIKDVVNQKILVSTAGMCEKIDAVKNVAGCQLKALQQLLPNTKVVTIFGDELFNQQTGISKSNPGVVISGTDDHAIEIVSQMLDSVGINTIPALTH